MSPVFPSEDVYHDSVLKQARGGQPRMEDMPSFCELGFAQLAASSGGLAAGHAHVAHVHDGSWGILFKNVAACGLASMGMHAGFRRRWVFPLSLDLPLIPKLG